MTCWHSPAAPRRPVHDSAAAAAHRPEHGVSPIRRNGVREGPGGQRSGSGDVPETSSRSGRGALFKVSQRGAPVSRRCSNPVRSAKGNDRSEMSAALSEWIILGPRIATVMVTAVAVVTRGHPRVAWGERALNSSLSATVKTSMRCCRQLWRATFRYIGRRGPRGRSSLIRSFPT